MTEQVAPTGIPEYWNAPPMKVRPLPVEDSIAWWNVRPNEQDRESDA